MIKSLIVNHTEQACGVYQFGKRVADVALESADVEYEYLETDDPAEFTRVRDSFSPDVIIYNWYVLTMPWLAEEMVTGYNGKHLFIFHDGFVRDGHYDGFLFFGAGEKDAPEFRRIPAEKTHILPRPLLEYRNTFEKNDIPHIGSFGFGSWTKGFDRITSEVNQKFERAVLNLHMPFARFGDEFGVETLKIAELCRSLNINPNVELNITHELLNEGQLLDFLAKNDLNVFYYRALNEGLSSVIDYALSVERPIAITDDMMFRHIRNDDIIVTPTNSIVDIMNKGTEPLKPLYNDWARYKLVQELDFVVREV
jgi:hypothetical protein